MTTLTTLDATAPLGEAIAVVERDGGVIIRDFFDSATLAELRADIDAAMAATPWGQDDFSGHRTKRLYGVFQHTQHAATAVRHPHYAGIASHFLEVPQTGFFGEDMLELTPSYTVGVSSIIDIHPGEGPQPLHRDDGVWQWRHPEGYRQARVQVMVAVTDFTAENGGTMVVPGSHLWGDDRGPRTDEAVPTVMSAGSALIWVGGTFHGGGTNTSDSNRIGLTIGLDLGFLRQEENAYLTYPVEVVKTFDEDIQQLLGWSVCAPGTGFVEHQGVMADPIFLLQGEGAEVTNSFAQFDDALAQKA
ncbi:phytanoyl-CoA dioxygenase family protein [Nocardioides sp. QY071]|uniref:phytanoyl-CoA dioxygenase family protein n=1 Tax=Nocardioides sp. QY071 TaxID=3044187 RepID=UPI00249C4979|nr:phytanoyl-CoA dioxygenase family protein [Nocardioides sp. QY071]WGY02858.1 phytanoyl-CoA dioxygenase family protein [Nocardioides sp. QY071]